MKQDKLYNLFLLSVFAFNILFFAYILSLLLYNSFTADDYGYLAMVKNADAFSFVTNTYLYHSGRFVRYFLYFWKFKLFDVLPFAPTVYPLCAYLLYVSSVYFLLSRMVQIKLSKLESLFFAALFVNIVMAISFEPTAFYWLAAIDFYSSAILYPVWLIYFCFICRKEWLSYTGLIVTSFVIGGSNEAFSPLYLFIIFSCFVWKFFADKQWFKSKICQHLIVAFVVMFASTVVCIIAPGNFNRMQIYMEKPSIASMLLISFKSVAVFLYLLMFKIPYIFVAMICCFYYGMRSNIKISVSKSMFFYSLVVLSILIWICTFPAAYGMNGFGFHRIYIPTLAIILAYVCVLSLIFGQRFAKYKLNKLAYVTCLFLVLGSVVQIINIVVDTPTVKKYYLKEKERHAIILKEKELGRTTPLPLEALPNLFTFNCKSVVLGLLGKNTSFPVLFYGNEISKKYERGTDDSFNNDCMISYYELPFTIFRK